MENKIPACLNADNPRTLRSLNRKEVEPLDSLIESILQERDHQTEFILISGHDDDDTGASVNTHVWPEMFSRGFLDNSLFNENSNETHDDLLFYVTHEHRTHKKPELQVFRRNSPKLPNPTDQHINWEETVYLNLLMQYFIYVVTVAVCTRTGAQEWQILKKFSQTVYASPSHRQMDTKGSKQEITYPDLYFNIDNYEEVFADCVVRDSDSLSVELTAYDKSKKIRGVCFMGTISYSTLKKVYDTKPTSKSNMLLSRTKSGSNSAYPSSSPIHNLVAPKFMRVIGPQSKGLAELAIMPHIDSDRIFMTDMTQWDDALNASSLVSRCCQTIQGNQTQPDAQFCSTNGYSISDGAYASVITAQPGTEPPKWPPNEFNPNRSKFINESIDDPCLMPQNPYSTQVLCRASPWSVKSAGASADTSPVRQWRLPGLSRNSSSTTMQNRYTFGRNLRSRKPSTVQTTNRRPSKISEILSAFTGPPSQTNRPENQSKVAFVVGGFDSNADGAVDQNDLTEQYAIQMRTNALNQNINLDNQNGIPFAHTDKRNNSFGQAWSWFKERRRLASIGLRASLTYISLPCQSILIDLLEVRQEPILTFATC